MDCFQSPREFNSIPTLFKDAFTFCKSCDHYQWIDNFGPKNQMTQTPILIVEIFDVWCIDLMGHFPSFHGYLYILLVVDYVSKWVDEKATCTNDANFVIDFFRSHIFSRFGMPREIIFVIFFLGTFEKNTTFIKCQHLIIHKWVNSMKYSIRRLGQSLKRLSSQTRRIKFYA